MELVLKVESLLKKKSYEMAALEIMKPDNLSDVQQEGMEIISKVCDVGLEAATEVDDISTCSKILNYICSCYSPKLALVSTLEQAETFLRSPKFVIILKAIQIVFERHPLKRAATYSWTLDLFNKHLQEYHRFPDGLKNKFTEGQESILVENDSKVRSIFQFYKELYTFYVPIVGEFVSKYESFAEKNDSDKEELGKQERILKTSLVNLLGHPLIYFDLTDPVQDDTKSPVSPRKSRSRLQMRKPQMSALKQKSEARLIAERIMKQIEQVNQNSSFFLKWAEMKCQPPPVLMTELDEIEYDEEVEEVEFQKPALANYFYLLYVENVTPEHTNPPYAFLHFFQVLLPLVNVLLLEDKQNYLTVQKGLLLAQKLISQLTEPLNSEFLTESTYSTFVEKLTELIVYFDVRSTRELAFAVLKSYFWKFDAAGRYVFFQFILIKGRHPGLVGYMIGQVKDCIALTLEKEGENLEEMEHHFLGQNLSKLLLQICVLREGAMTDLLDEYDQIMGTLNLLRFLLLRDGPSNKSGILDQMPKIDQLMLTPLRTALDLTKAHYVQRLKEMQDPDYKGGDQERNDGAGAGIEFTKHILVDGQEMGLDENVSTDDRIKAIKQGLCNIDILDCLLGRVNECYRAVK